MGIFAVHYTYPEDMTSVLQVRPQHRQWIGEQDWILVAGMYQGGLDEVSEGEPSEQEPSNAALIVAQADSVEQLVSRMDQDPYWQNGFVLRRVVREWNPPLGTRADALG